MRSQGNISPDLPLTRGIVNAQRPPSFFFNFVYFLLMHTESLGAGGLVSAQYIPPLGSEGFYSASLCFMHHFNAQTEYVLVC